MAGHHCNPDNEDAMLDWPCLCTRRTSRPRLSGHRQKYLPGRSSVEKCLFCIKQTVNLAILPAEMVQNGERPNQSQTSAEIANLNNDGVADTWLPYSKIILPPLTKFKTTSSLSADTKRSGGR